MPFSGIAHAVRRNRAATVLLNRLWRRCRAGPPPCRRAGTAPGAHIRQVADDGAGPGARGWWRRRRRGGSAGCDPARTVVAAVT